MYSVHDQCPVSESRPQDSRRNGSEKGTESLEQDNQSAVKNTISCVVFRERSGNLNYKVSVNSSAGPKKLSLKKHIFAHLNFTKKNTL